MTLIIDAIQKGDLSKVLELLSDPELQLSREDKKEALILAIRYGYLEVAKELLTYSVVVDDIVAKENYALRLAAYYGHLDVVEKLLEYPAAVDNIAARENYALREAAYYGHLDVVEKLLEYPAVVDNIAAEDYAVLREAAGQGRHLACYVIAEKCWGNIRNIPQHLKDHAEGARVIDSIRRGAKKYNFIVKSSR